jgi:hypothetical protein
MQAVDSDEFAAFIMQALTTVGVVNGLTSSPDRR